MSETTSKSRDTQATPPDRLVEPTFAALERTLLNLHEARAALPPEELDAYRAAQQSVIHARRSAETHEGLLQVC